MHDVVHYFVDQLGRDEFARMHPRDGREFDAVKCHHRAVATDRLDDVEYLHPGEPVWLGRAGRWDDTRVEAIDINGEKDLFAFDARAQFRQMPTRVDLFVEPDTRRVGCRADVIHFFETNRPNAELQDGRAQVCNAPCNTGVAVWRAIVAVTQVAMGIDLHQDKIAVDIMDGPSKSARDAVLTTQTNKHFAGCEMFAGTCMNGVDHGFGAGGVGCQGWQRVDPVVIGHFAVEFAVV